ncbi:hypothetical protein KCMC57_up54070 [Kitasatospora sp. CMC57]|uniref:Uncharacterized protein n=1 Tax=Kitasatospora sp. CMC57 TaxID=3231513 RepID=A0AB33K0N4_9ACTN
MTEQPTATQRIAETIRPAMLQGLQNADLGGPSGTQHINAWADWIAEAVFHTVVQPLAAERDAFADRVDTLSEIAKRHKTDYLDAVQDVQRLTARVTELEAELAALREPSAEPPTELPTVPTAD